MNDKTPVKALTDTDKIDQLWEAVFNHIPSQLRWQNTKINFILAINGVILALVALMVARGG